MRLRSLATSREFTLAALVVLLLGLMGSTSAVPTDPTRPQIPSAPASPAAPAEPRATAPQLKPAPKPRPAPRVAAPRIPIVDAAPRRPPKVDGSVVPVRLTSKDLDLSLPVRPVGVTKDQEMELPQTVKEVGWYRFGAHPSSATGTTVLAAHVDTQAEGLGQFFHLLDAKKGDAITVTDAAGRTFDYRIADATSLAKKQIDWDQVFDRRGRTRLVLITCGGAYDRDSGYRDNVLVTAFPSS